MTPSAQMQQCPDERVLLVGHEPDFSRTAFDLTGGRVDLKKGGLAAVRVEPGGGTLLVLLRPRELDLAGRAVLASRGRPG